MLAICILLAIIQTFFSSRSNSILFIKHSLRRFWLNRIINSNDRLYTWQIQQSNTCQYGNDIDTLEHHLFLCKHTKIFWSRIQNWSKNNLDTSIGFNVCEILFGIGIENNDSFNIMNFLILLGKCFINRSQNNGEPIYFIKFLILMINLKMLYILRF